MNAESLSAPAGMAGKVLAVICMAGFWALPVSPLVAIGAEWTTAKSPSEQPQGETVARPVAAEKVGKGKDSVSVKDARGEDTAAKWDNRCWLLLAILALVAFAITALIVRVRSICPACRRPGLRETGEIKRQGWFQAKVEQCKCRYCGHVLWREEYQPPEGGE